MSAYQFSRSPRRVPLVETKHRRIKTEIPAPGTAGILERLDAVESRSMHGQLPIVWEDAYGSSVGDICGNKFIDFTSGIFVANVGHSNPHVLYQFHKAEFLHSYTYATGIRAAYLEKLTRWSGFDKAFLLSAGTEATEAALKLMRLYGAKRGAKKVICIDGAFHGRTMGAQSMSGSGTGDKDVYHMPFPDNEPFGIPLLSGVCGIMLETYQGWSAKFYPQEFVSLVAHYCQHQGVLLCFDEMQAGFGRAGKKFGFEHYGVKPDLICVGKGMGGGFPISGVLGRADIMDLPEVGEMSSTHSANPMACAAGLAVIREMERLDLVNEAARKGRILMDELCHIGEPYGKGLVASLMFDSAEFASRVAERCYHKGLLVVHTGRESIKIGPPLVISDDALIEGVEVLAEAISEIEQEAS